jgi:hypothetical protein
MIDPFADLLLQRILDRRGGSPYKRAPPVRAAKGAGRHTVPR